jgi:hypothetical protein
MEIAVSSICDERQAATVSTLIFNPKVFVFAFKFQFAEVQGV